MQARQMATWSTVGTHHDHAEKVVSITAALEASTTKTVVCRSFGTNAETGRKKLRCKTLEAR